MAAYSMDLRKRVLADSDAGLPTKQVAEKYGVSRTWVRSLKQRRRETGNIAPRVPTGRPRKIDREQLAALVKRYPDATLVELRDRLGVDCSPTAIWMALDAMRISFKKKRCAPPSETGRTSPKSACSGGRGKSGLTRGGSSSSTKRGPTRK
jgi:putative transposase